MLQVHYFLLTLNLLYVASGMRLYCILVVSLAGNSIFLSLLLVFVIRIYRAAGLQRVDSIEKLFHICTFFFLALTKVEL